MRRITHRSLVNSNNMGHYSRLDRAIDDAKEGQVGITSIIGRRTEPDRTPARRPLRTLTTGDAAPSGGTMVRVYGENYLGMAMSRQTLLSLIELGYLDGETVQVKGRLEGRPIDAIIHEHEFDKFMEAVA